MNLPEPIPPKPKKKMKPIWIIVIILAIVLICCIVVAIVGGGYLYLRRGSIQLPFSASPTPSPTATHLPTATLMPTETTAPLVVDPANPASSTYPTLADLAPNYSGSTTPGSQTWQVSIPRNQPALVFMGWCTASQDILDFNLQHISYTLTVDGQPVEVNSLYKWDSQETDQVCETWVGLIRQWTGTHHTIVTTMTMDWALNDGWDDYLAGDYTDVFEITVTP